MAIPLLPAGGGATGSASLSPGGTVLGAILLRWDSSAYLPTAFPNDLWLAEEPEELAFPFAVIDHQGETIEDWTSEDEVQETTLVEFRLFQVGARNVEYLAMLVKNRFDWCNQSLPFSAGSCVYCERTNYQVMQTDLRNAAGQVVHVAKLDYKILTTRAMNREK